MLNWVGRLTQVPSDSLTGRAIRLPLRLIPSSLPVPIFLGLMRGYVWTVGSGNHSCWLGVYERGKQQLFAGTIPLGAIVFDVGAHAGFYSLLFARLVGPAGRVVAFEPSPRNITFLRNHIALNGLRNVDVVEAAVADSSGTAGFAERSSSYTGALQQDGSVRVQIVRIDDIVATGRFPEPNFIKIDVEGAEDLVLAGARSTIMRAHPTIFLATHGSDVDARCVELLASMNYQVNTIPGDTPEWRELVARPVPAGKATVV